MKDLEGGNVGNWKKSKEVNFKKEDELPNRIAGGNENERNLIIYNLILFILVLNARQLKPFISAETMA